MLEVFPTTYYYLTSGLEPNGTTKTLANLKHNFPALRFEASDTTAGSGVEVAFVPRNLIAVIGPNLTFETYAEFVSSFFFLLVGESTFCLATPQQLV